MMKLMKQDKQQVPQFIPYEKINICGNIVGTKYLLELSGYYPIIIGRGDVPLIWLYVEMNGIIIPLVEQNTPKTPQIRVVLNDTDIKIKVFNLNEKLWIPMLEMNFVNSEQPIISRIDLRPIGINFHGEENALWISDKKIINMNIEGVRALIGIG